MRDLVIGDIHGGLRALIQVLLRSNYNPKLDRIVFLGDYVDGWSESAEVVQYLIELQAEATRDNIFLRGNHDAWCEDWLTKGISLNNWLAQGGQSTVESYIRTGLLVEDSHKRFFRNMVNYYVDEENRGFVHGGFISTKGLGHEQYQADYYWDRSLWEASLSGHSSQTQPKILNSYEEVYIGHTSTLSLRYKHSGPQKVIEEGTIGDRIVTPVNACNLWNLDTGGGWFGKLTCMDINTKEYWQSDLVKELYPEEKGR